MTAQLRIRTIDAHTAGEPLRIVTGGIEPIPGETILAKRRFAREHLEHVRRALMLEPRGHADMYGCILTEPTTEDGDVGVLFLHNEGYSTMCGHGIIALATVGLEQRLFAVRDESAIRIDTPAGRVTARADRDGERVRSVTFENVPSFVFAPALDVPVPDLGAVRCDVAFGGAFYAYVDAASVGLDLEARELPRIIDHGKRIKHAVAEACALSHPSGDADLEFLYGVIFVGPATAPRHSRNVCVFADGEVDRCPTGTGVSGRAAIHHARGELAVGDWITIESVLGTPFDVRAAATCRAGTHAAIRPEVRGAAHTTGFHEFLVDPEDPLRDGFLLR